MGSPCQTSYEARLFLRAQRGESIVIPNERGQGQDHWLINNPIRHSCSIRTFHFSVPKVLRIFAPSKMGHFYGPKYNKLMDSKNAIFRWLSSGGAYFLLAIIWLTCIIVFGFKARQAGRDKNSSNDGCYLVISTTVFVLTGGAIGLYLFQSFFPWYILTSLAGAIAGPSLAIRTFRNGKRKY
jgi:hypothetical protein